MTSLAPQYHEAASHGAADFPLGWYPDLTQAWDHAYFAPHWHEEAELIAVAAGQMELVVDGTARVMGAGDCALIAPNTLHAAFTTGDAGCLFDALVVAPALLETSADGAIARELIQPFLTQQYGAVLVVAAGDSRQPALAATMAAFHRVYQTPRRSRRLMLLGLVFELVGLMLDDTPAAPPAVSSVAVARQRRIITFIAAHYTKPLTLDDLAAALALSREQFCRFFRATFRQSPMAYLRGFRLTQARRLLAGSAESIAEISAVTGFQTPAYFATAFARAYGQTPTAYRLAHADAAGTDGDEAPVPEG